MGWKCAAFGCTSGYATCTEKVPLFKFPEDPTIRKKWIHACKRLSAPDQNYAKARLCEKHFLPEDIIRKRVQQKKKKKGENKPIDRKYVSIKPGAYPQLHPQLVTMPGINPRLQEEENRKMVSMKKRSYPMKKDEIERREILQKLINTEKDKQDENGKRKAEKKAEKIAEIKAGKILRKKRMVVDRLDIRELNKIAEMGAEMRRQEEIDKLADDHEMEILAEYDDMAERERFECEQKEADAIENFQLFQSQFHDRMDEYLKLSEWDLLTLEDEGVQLVKHKSYILNSTSKTRSSHPP